MSLNTIISELEEWKLDVLMTWYGFKFHKQLEEIRNFWENVWFCKGPNQKILDEQLRKFEQLFEKEYVEDNTFYGQLAQIILYDQISRNIFRGTAKAYVFDKHTEKILNNILNRYSLESINKFNVQYVCTIMIALAHMENDLLHKKLSEIYMLFKETYKRHHPDIIVAMERIIDNHSIRINLFGRIPERNKIIGRLSTKQEDAFLSALY